MHIRLLMLAITAFVLSANANADTVFINDFEVGDHTAWLHTVLPGARCCNGSVGVESHNNSLMAFTRHSGNGQDSLSKDFDYVANELLSFDMHAVANVGHAYNRATLHSMSGVKISFLSFLNSELGSFTIANTTNSGWLNTDDVSIDSAQHNYLGVLGDYATFAGLGDGDPITKFSLEFFSTSQFSFGGNIYLNGASSANVWFDNVTVTAVPVPAAVWLLGSGLLGLIIVTRGKKSQT